MSFLADIFRATKQDDAEVLQNEQTAQLNKQDYIQLTCEQVSAIYDSLRNSIGKGRDNKAHRFCMELDTDHMYIYNMNTNKLAFSIKFDYALSEKLDKIYVKNIAMDFFNDLHIWVCDVKKDLYISPHHNSMSRYITFAMGSHNKILVVRNKCENNQS